MEINTSPIAFGRLIPLGENKYEISGVYVKETLRGRGYGRRLVQFILNSIKETDIIYCVPFKHLINFYTSFGWRETLTEDEKLQLPQQIKEKVQWCNCKFTDQCTLLILKKSMTI
jgi:predicted GNAT family acetyltransferase